MEAQLQSMCFEKPTLGKSGQVRHYPFEVHFEDDPQSTTFVGSKGTVFDVKASALSRLVEYIVEELGKEKATAKIEKIAMEAMSRIVEKVQPSECGKTLIYLLEKSGFDLDAFIYERFLA